MEEIGKPQPKRAVAKELARAVVAEAAPAAGRQKAPAQQMPTTSRKSTASQPKRLVIDNAEMVSQAEEQMDRELAKGIARAD